MSNEDQLAELLNRLASSAPRPDLDDLNQRIANAAPGSKTLSTNQPDEKQPVSAPAAGRKIWWLAAAAVALAATIGLTQVRGSDPVELAIASFPNGPEAPQQTIQSWMASGEREIVIWADNESTPEQRAAIEDYLAESPLVDSVLAVSRTEIFEEFQEFWKDEPEILAAVQAEDLPYRIDVTLRDNTTAEDRMFLDLTSAVEGVDSVGYVDTSSD